MNPDPEQFLPLFLAAQSDLRAFIGATVRDRALREDVFQEVFTSVAQRIGEFHDKNRHSTFRGWLRIITRSRLVDHLRRENKEPQAEGLALPTFYNFSSHFLHV